jgi:hypothetical protein
MEIQNDLRTRRATLAYRHPAADHSVTGAVLAVIANNKKRASQHGGGALPPEESGMITKTLMMDDVEGIHDFIEDAEIVEGPDELWQIVSERWPELLHKLKPPRALMH